MLQFYYSISNYTYGDSKWKDSLTALDGHSITYDDIGNPLTYYNGTDWTFTWANGRNLATATGGDKTISYTYDSEGLRTTKIINGEEHTYIYLGGQLVEERWGTNNYLLFTYDEQGRPYSVNYNGGQYYYVLNQQGDVIRIVAGDGTIRAEYRYNAWGEVEETENSAWLGKINPLRYRGYYYDSESGLYYLNTRYYDLSIGRFISTDNALSGIGGDVRGYNMFSYCFTPVYNFLI